MGEAKRPGEVLWIDLTVPEAERVRDFYREVVGFEVGGVDMGGYEDFELSPPGGRPVAGVCHARAGNAGLPAQWLVYFAVDDLDASLERTREGGGEVIAGPKRMPGHGRYAVVRDPSGAVAALFEQS